MRSPLNTIGLFRDFAFTPTLVVFISYIMRNVAPFKIPPLIKFGFLRPLSYKLPPRTQHLPHYNEKLVIMGGESPEKQDLYNSTSRLNFSIKHLNRTSLGARASLGPPIVFFEFMSEFNKPK